MKVIHATEALAGGVLTALSSLVAAQCAEGIDVEVIFTRRKDTPGAASLQLQFPAPVVLTEVVSGRKDKASALLSLARLIRHRSSSEPDSIIHLHSSWAGFVGRMPLIGANQGRSAPILYSPHGYAFLRLDVPTAVREGFKVAEAMLARRGVSVLVSPSEEALARDALRAPRTDLLTNAVRVHDLPPRAPRAPEKRLKVAMAGRVSYQKAPWRFERLSHELQDLADFVWIGGADPGESPFTGQTVRMTGWLPRDEALKELADCDVFCFPTLWEGMPMTLLEAQSLGVPCVVSDIVGNRDAVVDSITGYVVRSDDDLIQRTQELLMKPELRERMGAAAAERARSLYGSERLGPESVAMYTRWLGQPARLTSKGRW